MDQQNQYYNVYISKYAQRFFIKSFNKKYKGAWDDTLSAVISTVERIDNTLLYDRADVLKFGDTTKLVKLSFAVSGRRESPKGSGNRCVLFVDEELRKVEILIMYHKSDLPKNTGETQYINTTVKEVFPDYWQTLLQ